MNEQNNMSDDGPTHRNGRHSQRKHDDVPSQPAPAPTDAVEQFRRLLAKMIARQIAAERNAPRPSGGEDRN